MVLHEPSPVPSSDIDLVIRIRNGDEGAFRILFDRYYLPLKGYAQNLSIDPESSEEIVLALFARLWERRESWVFRENDPLTVRAYLYRAVYRRTIDVWRGIRRQFIREDDISAVPVDLDQADTPERLFERADLEAAYERAVAALPPRRRQAFQLHRQHELTYREIAQVMGVSPRTVEMHIGEALLTLRNVLAAYLSVILVLSAR